MLENIIWIVGGVVVIGIIVFLVSKNIKRAVQVMSGWGIYQVLSAIYDYPFWAYIQFRFEVWGSVGLSIGALIINFFLLRWYIKRGVDWLGVNILEDIKKNAHLWIDRIVNNPSRLISIVMYVPAKFFGLLITALNKNDVFAFFFLSIWQDPFIATSFLRHGNTRPINKRDYYVLLGSTVVTSIFWSVVIEIVLKIIERIIML